MKAARDSRAAWLRVCLALELLGEVLGLQLQEGVVPVEEGDERHVELRQWRTVPQLKDLVRHEP